MSVDFSAVCPRELHPDLAWIGRLDWCHYDHGPVSDNGLPRTQIFVQWDVIEQAPGFDRHQRIHEIIENFHRTDHLCAISWLHFCSLALAGGPKMFVPTDEQFESMRHVHLNVAPRDFRSPYPTLVVRTPPESRRNIAEETGIDPARIPAFTLVGTARSVRGGTTVHTASTFDVDTTIHHVFQDQPQNPTIETVLQRVILNNSDIGEEYADHVAGADLARASLNLCLMLTMYGHRNAGPLDPAAYEKHRKRGDLAKFKHGDFEAVKLQQEIVVRKTVARPSGDRPEGGPMYEVKPHWRRGHMRRLPGWEAYAERNEPAPLTFVRPCVIHPDRLVGNISESSATYYGR